MYFFGTGGGKGEIRPCNSNIANPRRFYEHFYGFHALRTVGKCTSRHLFRYSGLFLDILTGLLLFSPSQLLTRPNRKITHHVYVKRQTRICTAWPSFLFTCRLLLIISTPKLVISRNFSSIRIVLSCFYLLIFYFEKFSTWIWRLPYKWSLNSLLTPL